MFNGAMLYNLELGLVLIFILELQHIGENSNVKSPNKLIFTVC